MKHLKYLLGVGALFSMLMFAGCDEEEVSGTCAGCPSDTPWSVFGSDQCYKSLDDCEAAEKGNCTICDG
ncbi:hypothetical protein [Marinoscillum furvescens]|uniref:Uncharacterized protein n=1 Tax=Marinoscillum furvescens DSM 4134 TaxID=1122208 RepID=A0A3D9L107_MARFU|nr:hypothetical protein [Marinoscillum furvescens]RED93900.1 hypothetical protein C7460_12380 [Marinoscillum furvescens DSM 4134]